MKQRTHSIECHDDGIFKVAGEWGCMEKTVAVINALEKEGTIGGYALGGAMALLFYAEPALTYDVDVFLFLPGDKGAGRLLDLGPLYRTLETKGYRAEKEHVLIEGIPVQFIPVYNALVEEAVREASTKEYQGVKTKVIRMEHLLAIMIDTNRPRDRERIARVLQEVEFDRPALRGILKRHSLEDRWEEKIGKC